MCKKILLFLLCAAMLFSAACSPAGTGTDTATDPGKTGTSTDNTGVDTNTLQRREFDLDIQHKILVTDVLNYELVVLDLNKSGSFEALEASNLVEWTWNSQTSGSRNFQLMREGLDDAKYRYSELYETDVIITCSSSGWAGIVAYPSGELLYEVLVDYGPHSVELMPNGDFIVACSDEAHGGLNYYALSIDEFRTTPVAQYPMSGCHGVCWNPELNRLIIDGYTGIHALEVKGYGSDAVQLIKDDAYSLDFSSTIPCHDIMPVAGTNGEVYYVTANSVYRYTVSKRKLAPESYPLSAHVAKGIASFTDGTVVLTPSGDRSGSPRFPDTTCVLTVVSFAYSTGKVKELQMVTESTVFRNREFYKVRSFTKDYQ